jgi:predicted secreted protein
MTRDSESHRHAYAKRGESSFVVVNRRRSTELAGKEDVRKSLPVLAVSLAAVAMTACGTASAAQRHEPTASITVGQAANGHTVRAGSGTDVVVRLPASRDGGYLWTVTRTGGLDLVSHRYLAPASKAPGASGEDMFVFADRTNGHHHLTLSDSRPWKGGGTAGTFNLTVVTS